MDKLIRKGRIMTALELKTQIIHDIDNEQNNAILEKLQKYYRKLKTAEKAKPCQYTIEEVNSRLDKAEEEAKNGEGTEHGKFMAEEVEK